MIKIVNSRGDLLVYNDGKYIGIVQGYEDYIDSDMTWRGLEEAIDEYLLDDINTKHCKVDIVAALFNYLRAVYNIPCAPAQKTLRRYSNELQVSDAGDILYNNMPLIPDNYHGYCRINLYLGYKTFFLRVHQLVATLYLANPDNKPYVHHINKITSDNRKENLVWVTAKEHSGTLCHRGFLFILPHFIFSRSRCFWYI